VKKLGWSALILCILSLVAISARSQSNDAPSDSAAPRAELTPKPGDADRAKPDNEQPLTKTMDSVFAELQRLSEDAKANREKFAQSIMLRSDVLKLVQDAKASNEKTAQIMLDQIDALRSDQVKFVNDTTTKVERLKAETARSVDGVKRDLDELRQSISDIPPGLAVIIALVALVLGPLAARQLTANQLANARAQAIAEAAAPAGPDADEPAGVPIPQAPPAAPPPHQTVNHYNVPAHDERARADHDARAEEEV